ncbi:type III secretion protein [Brenneria sp. g21c3]|nr:type III secretion protein [Brenneria sp. g21c3]
MTDRARIDWVTWWAGGCVLQAAPGWDDKHGFTPATRRLELFIHANPAAVCRCFDLPMQIPPEPQPSLMRIGELNVGQRTQILHLMAAVCLPSRHRREISAERQIWCRRLAKALRPGLWLPDCCTFAHETDALMLLRARYGEACWPRLRLLYPRGLVERVADFKHPLPAGRLNALCDALIWKVAAPERIATHS